MCSEKFCDSWPKVVYQLGDHLMDDVGGKSVYVPVRQTNGVFNRRYPPFSEFLVYLAFLRTEQTRQTIRDRSFNCMANSSSVKTVGVKCISAAVRA